MQKGPIEFCGLFVFFYVCICIFSCVVYVALWEIAQGCVTLITPNMKCLCLVQQSGIMRCDCPPSFLSYMHYKYHPRLLSSFLQTSTGSGHHTLSNPLQTSIL